MYCWLNPVIHNIFSFTRRGIFVMCACVPWHILSAMTAETNLLLADWWDEISVMESFWMAEPPQALTWEILTTICQQNKAQIESRQQYVSVPLGQTAKLSLQVCARENVNKLWYLARLQVSLPAFGHSPSGPESQRMSCFHCKTEQSGHQRRDETVWRRKKNNRCL